MAVSMASDASTTTSSCLVFDAFQHLLHQMKFVLPFEEVHEVYAQLTGSTVESLKMTSRSNAASCKSAHKLAGVRRYSKHGPLTSRRNVTGSCWNWSIVLTFHLLEYSMFSLIVSQYIG
ncbi:uncharacterized protein LOC110690699 isoform X2 [Chenopodium quinoa]|uniref:uncharacterized protein LOC110690699 isoform X2 n=1 Tax=Chenopodium quinoa TaxID=63459 RepID=UPI000B778EFC|nr:uncharacterized protein LOC110690699 isoform X2 [Chenopodium quinoa]